ncbi:23S rRNA (adenine(2030)-N(6))-methyltransferase RlmJ [Halomonas borealis]|uniref:23S rRNA (adenine(2030)-N(6))-methyltransferase RlmJ n=1 Tax=Halomonas borealis TaxID=2508710 RepID=UPI00109F9083|nr:23S rRNA (adenine(2030)-N(6))-methyltransferase RlmJ [Halomonas borealis]
MLSYQHAYHAGNFADVHKHLVLYSVADHLLRKKSPITYIDTHAGRGLYPLDADETTRLQEYRDGVARLWEERERLSATTPLLSDWLMALVGAQQGSGLAHYPGSPWWLSHRLREQDRLRLFELHPAEHGHLADQALSSAVQRIQGDGLAGLLKALPVKTPRLCVLIDPSYERKAEYEEVVSTLLSAMRKARHAVVMVWYPLLPAGRHQTLLEGLRDAGLRKIWRSELRLREPQEGERGMIGSGMLVVNPPWGLDARIAESMDALLPLWGSTARHHGDWWVGE